MRSEIWAAEIIYGVDPAIQAKQYMDNGIIKLSEVTNQMNDRVKEMLRYRMFTCLSIGILFRVAQERTYRSKEGHCRSSY